MPSLSPQNLAAIEVGKDFMLSHGYIKNDFDVQKWAAPEFLEQAAKEVIEEQWKKVTAAKLPEADCASARIRKENKLWLSLELTWDRSPPRS